MAVTWVMVAWVMHGRMARGWLGVQSVAWVMVTWAGGWMRVWHMPLAFRNLELVMTGGITVWYCERRFKGSKRACAVKQQDT